MIAHTISHYRVVEKLGGVAVAPLCQLEIGGREQGPFKFLNKLQ